MAELRGDKFDKYRTRSRGKYSKEPEGPNVGKIIAAVIGVVAVVALIVVISYAIRNRGGSSDPAETGKAGTTAGAVEEITTQATEEAADPSRYELKKDAYPEINQLYETYYQAMKDRDVETLSKIVDGYTFTQEEVDKESEYIEDYRNISCYTIDGILEGTYVVYVYHEVKFRNIDTYAPGLYGSYVCTNEDGSLYINEGLVEGEVAAFIEEMDSSDDVRALNQEVDQALAQAQASDPALDNLVTMLQAASGQQPATQPAATEPAATEPAATQAPEQTDAEPATQAPTEAPTQAPAQEVFSEVNETVYAKESVRIRSSMDTSGSDNVVATLVGGQTVTRTGSGQNWSRITYNGQTCYIKAGFLTREKPQEPAEED